MSYLAEALTTISRFILIGKNEILSFANVFFIQYVLHESYMYDP